jgi:formylglycine-generating enzyme required for sulfatase activity
MAPDSTETVFISYAREDEAFAQRLNTDLQRRGIATWIDELGIRGGDDWPTRIATALAGCKAVLVVVSPDSMASRWVQRELSFADAEGKRILPLIHRQCEQPRWFRLRFGNVQWVDFSEGSYEANLAELLTSIEQVLALPVTAPPPSPVPEPPPAPREGTSVHIGGDVSGQIAIGSGISQVGAVRAAPEQQPKATCPACGADVRPDARFCPECGKSLAAVLPVTAQAPPDVLTITSPIHLELVRVPAGKFLMGSDPAKDEYAKDDEQPQHRVYVPGFYIAKYAVTNVQYAAFVRAVKHSLPGGWKGGEIPVGKENHPVVDVTWHDAVAFCEWLSRETGRPFRLPTEAEWEKAARGTDGRLYPWGDEPPTAELGNVGFYDVEDTAPVGQYSPQGDSPYGCADMAGNVWEWTHSLYRGYPYDPTDGREELEAGEFKDIRAWRGGSWRLGRPFARCSCRNRGGPGRLHHGLGFRCASPVSDSES